uniref:type IX secretion system plug protein n=1 Tax=Flavobacterium agricola TaxID=2870839 RepID=UPI00293935C1|nr:DUF5103 domain-containing protein [Flavobacterium agricola]
MKNIFCWIILFLCYAPTIWSQNGTEVAPPYNIKTVSFKNGGHNMVPIFKLGETFTFEFDDLFGNNNDYYFTIVHCDTDWKPTNILKQDYLQGNDGTRILNYENSFNTLQMYSHYSLKIPNDDVKLLISGNYMLNILNDQQEVVFSRRFVLYEDLVSIPIQVKRGRNVETINEVQNLDFAVKMGDLQLQTPFRNIDLIILQNGDWNTSRSHIKPQYTIANDLIYKYDKETQFLAGNQFLNFDNSNVRVASNNIQRITLTDLYNSFLYTNIPRANQGYTYNPDIYGNFLVRNVDANDPEIEADYVWVYFSLAQDELPGQSIYVTGMFNNYLMTDENKMAFNKKTNKYEVALLIKQGFTNFQYTLVNDKTKQINLQNAIDGNYFQTQNNYIILAYSQR